MSAKRAKSGGVTLKKARQAARAVKGNRPAGTFVVVKASKSKALRERYLGVIVHSPSRAGSGSRVSWETGASAKHGAVRMYAKKK